MWCTIPQNFGNYLIHVYKNRLFQKLLKIPMGVYTTPCAMVWVSYDAFVIKIKICT